jgi:aconitate decarboxylase
MHQTSSGHVSHTRRIAEFVSNLRYQDIPSEVIARIKLLILDSFGCAIYGRELPWSSTLREILQGVDATRTCRVWELGIGCRRRMRRW